MRYQKEPHANHQVPARPAAAATIITAAGCWRSRSGRSRSKGRDRPPAPATSRRSCQFAAPKPRRHRPAGAARPRKSVAAQGGSVRGPGRKGPSRPPRPAPPRLGPLVKPWRCPTARKDSRQHSRPGSRDPAPPLADLIEGRVVHREWPDCGQAESEDCIVCFPATWTAFRSGAEPPLVRAFSVNISFCSRWWSCFSRALELNLLVIRCLMISDFTSSRAR
mmetsp:Transcript_42882/g.127075  ORF Transcript_42882/g.127075 Transcript_42882/m.127075 type:complete len:221 (-) Transcript_42882:1477-2139(-)